MPHFSSSSENEALALYFRHRSEVRHFTHATQLRKSYFERRNKIKQSISHKNYLDDIMTTWIMTFFSYDSRMVIRYNSLRIKIKWVQYSLWSPFLFPKLENRRNDGPLIGHILYEKVITCTMNWNVRNSSKLSDFWNLHRAHVTCRLTSVYVRYWFTRVKNSRYYTTAMFVFTRIVEEF